MPFKPTQVAKMLGTANDAEQVKRIQALQQPVACITILYDPRMDSVGVAVLGGPIAYAAVRMVLQRAIEGSIQEEAAKRAAATPPAPVAPAPPASATPSREGA